MLHKIQICLENMIEQQGFKDACGKIGLKYAEEMTRQSFGRLIHDLMKHEWVHQILWNSTDSTKIILCSVLVHINPYNAYLYGIKCILVESSDSYTTLNHSHSANHSFSIFRKDIPPTKSEAVSSQGCKARNCMSGLSKHRDLQNFAVNCYPFAIYCWILGPNIWENAAIETKQTGKCMNTYAFNRWICGNEHKIIPYGQHLLFFHHAILGALKLISQHFS